MFIYWGLAPLGRLKTGGGPLAGPLDLSEQGQSVLLLWAEVVKSLTSAEVIITFEQ